MGPLSLTDPINDRELRLFGAMHILRLYMVFRLQSRPQYLDLLIFWGVPRIQSFDLRSIQSLNASTLLLNYISTIQNIRIQTPTFT